MLKTKAHEEHVIACALHVAVDTYEKDAAEFTRAGLGRSAHQFKRQAQDARAVLERIENGDLSLLPEYLSLTGRRMLERQDGDRLHHQEEPRS